jgi:Lon-like protease
LRAGITPFRIGVGIIVALVVTALILQRIRSDDYLIVPDVAHPVAPLVHVHGAKPAKDGGKLFFVDIQEIQPTKLHDLFRWLFSDPAHSTRIPASRLIPHGSTGQAYHHAELRQMASSQLIAGAVAERQLGLHVVEQPNGVLVDNTYADVPAASKIDPADIIVAVNGKPTLTLPALQAALAVVKPGQTVALKILRGSQTLNVPVRTVKDPKDSTRALIGIEAESSARIAPLPVHVSIDSGNIGGPSAGLAFTLEVMEQLGANVLHGYKVAATGTISLNGAVGPIGGIVQKTWGVRAAGAQVFLVPRGFSNYEQARANAGPHLRVIPVKSLKQALHALAALPKLK